MTLSNDPPSTPKAPGGGSAACGGARPDRERIGASLLLQRVCKDYGASHAVREVDLAISPGEFVTLLGASGSGKTTTLMMIAGFAVSTSGDIFIDGRSVTGLPPSRRNLGVVFQNYSLFPHLTVHRNISFPLEMRGVERTKRDKLVNDILDLVRLPEKAASFPRELSGGQQQRVALARALVFGPRVLLMDEPLGALDKKLREQMQLEIKRIQGELGATVVYVTHDQEEALTMSDRVAVMQAGRIVQIGKPQELYERPVSRWVADFVGQSNFINARIESSTEDGTATVRFENGEIGAVTCADAGANGAAATVVLRPEKLVLQPVQADSRGARNRLTGVVTGVVYLGHATRRTVTLASGATIQTQNANRSGGGPFEPGQPVAVHWAPEDAWLLPAEDRTP